MSMIEDGKTYQITSLCSATAKRRLNLYSAGTASDGMNVVLYTPDNTKEQQWLLKDSRLYTRTNPSYCLDRYNLKSSSFHDNADIYRASTKEDLNQKVSIVASGEGYRVQLTGQPLYLTAQSDNNGTSSGKRATSPGNVYWAGPRGDNTQLWSFAEIGAKTADNSASTEKVPSGQATLFPTASFYTTSNNPLFPAYLGECTWYCIGRAHQVMGTKNLPTSNAKTWYSVAQGRGFRLTGPNDNPVPKSIAVWGKGDYGHVAFVEAVIGSNVYFSEANWYAAGDPRLSNKKVEPPPYGTDGQIKSASIAQFKARYAPFIGCILL